MTDPMNPANVPDDLVQAAVKAMSNRKSPEGISYAPGGWWEEDARVALAAALPIHERQVRELVAADIRDHPGPNPSPANPAWWAGYVEAQSDCARIAAGVGTVDDDA